MRHQAIPSPSCATPTRGSRGASRTGPSWTTTPTPFWREWPWLDWSQGLPEVSSTSGTSIPNTALILDAAIREAEEAGFLGESVLGTDFTFRIYLRRGAGAYICGEESSLLNSLEGKHPFPRNRPPYPVTHGFENLPTVVNNVETLASVPPILRNGGSWYRGLGMNGQAGTKVISLSGDILRPGQLRGPHGLPAQEPDGGMGGRARCGTHVPGRDHGRPLRWIPRRAEDLEVTLDEPSIRAKGSFLGAGGIMVFDDTRDMVDVARMAMEFFAEESCGKCFPCRIGTRRLTERLAGQAGPGELAVLDSRGGRSGTNHEGDQRLRAGNGGSPHYRVPAPLLPGRGGPTRAGKRSVNRTEAD